jgi:hypothetical protein
MRIIRQRGSLDCGVATAAMLCKKTYKDAEKADPNRYAERGMYVKEFVTCCLNMGVTIRVRRLHPRRLLDSKVIEEQAMIIRKPNAELGHFIYVANSTVYDPELSKPWLVTLYPRRNWHVIRSFVL